MPNTLNPYAPPTDAAQAVLANAAQASPRASPQASLAHILDGALPTHGFVHHDLHQARSGQQLGNSQHDCNGLLKRAWRRRTWSSNRAAVLLQPNDTLATPAVGQWVQQHKIAIGKAVGYVPFFYGVGLQVIVAGVSLATPATGLENYVDKFDNQRAIIQSLYLVDEALGRYQWVRTWGQALSATFQDAIDEALAKSFTRVTAAT